jgi:SAM-dependent methyltransferase
MKALANSTLADLAENFSGDTFVSAPLCPICGGASRIAHPAFNIHPAKFYRFNFRVCVACGHGWIDPMPSQGLLNYLYGLGSQSVIGAEWPEVEVSSLSVPGQLVSARELRAGAPARRYFELGPGKGLLYTQFIDRGWECHGVEPGAWGQKLPGVFSDFSAMPKSLAADVIVALDVLEHISNPVAALRQLRSLAAPGAKVYAAMPNRESLRARIGREDWRMLRPLGHVNYWSRSSVSRAFAQAGFNIEELRKTDLWQRRPINSLRSAAVAAIEFLGLADQWIVIARVN